MRPIEHLEHRECQNTTSIDTPRQQRDADIAVCDIKGEELTTDYRLFDRMAN
jgi:hypothetical protein